MVIFGIYYNANVKGKQRSGYACKNSRYFTSLVV